MEQKESPKYIEQAGVDSYHNIGTKSSQVRETTGADLSRVNILVEDFETNSCIGCSSTFWGEWVLEGAENRPDIIVDPDDDSNHVLDSDISRPDTPYGNANSRSEPTWRPRKAPHPNPTWPAYKNFFPLELGKEISFQFRFKIAKEHDWDDHSSDSDVFDHIHPIHQMKPPQGIVTGNPNTSLRLKNRKLELLMRWQPDPDIIANGPDVKEEALYPTSESPTLNKGIWYYVIIDTKLDYRNTTGSAPSGGGSGLVKVYFKSGSWPTASDLLFNHLNGNMYNTTLANGLGVYFKFGIYRHVWRHQKYIDQDAAVNVNRSRIYFDDVTLKDALEF